MKEESSEEAAKLSQEISDYDPSNIFITNSAELEEIREKYEIHRLNKINGYTDFNMKLDNFLIKSEFSWEF